MKLLLRPCSSLILVGSLLTAALPAQADNGTWNIPTGGTYSTPSSWVDLQVANGADFTANFNTQDISGTVTVNLDTPRTLGGLIFGDTATATAGGWILAHGGVGANTLTLDVATGAPTVTVNALGTSSAAFITAVIAGSDGLRKAGVGQLVLSNANTFTGETSISEGTLTINNSSALGSSVVTVASAAMLQLQNNGIVANAINLNGTTALLNSSGNNTLSGPVALQSASTISLGASSSSSLAISGTLSLGANNLSVSATAGGRVLTLGAVNGSGALVLNTNTTASMSVDNVTGDAATTFSGEIQLIRGTLALGNNEAAGTGNIRVGVNDQGSTIRSTDTSTRTIANTLSYVGNSSSRYVFGSTSAATNGDLIFTNTANTNLGGIRKFEVYNRTELRSGFVGGTGGIILQTAGGTLVLSGVNTYGATTAVNAGTLLVNGSLTGTSAVAVTTAATLGGSGSIRTAATVSVGDGGTIAPGDGVGTLSVGSVSFASGGDFKLELNGGTAGLGYDQLNVTGTVNLNINAGAGADLLLSLGAGFAPALFQTFTLLANDGVDAISGSFGTVNGASFDPGNTFTLTNDTGSYSLQLLYTGEGSAASGGNDLVAQVVPEPALGALLAGGMGLLLGIRRSRGRFVH